MEQKKVGSPKNVLKVGVINFEWAKLFAAHELSSLAWRKTDLSIINLCGAIKQIQ